MRDVERRLRTLEAAQIARVASRVVSIGSLAWSEVIAGLPHDLMYPSVVREWYDSHQKWLVEKNSSMRAITDLE